MEEVPYFRLSNRMCISLTRIMDGVCFYYAEADDKKGTELESLEKKKTSGYRAKTTENGSIDLTKDQDSIQEGFQEGIQDGIKNGIQDGIKDEKTNMDSETSSLMNRDADVHT